MTIYEPIAPDPRVTVWDKDGIKWEPDPGSKNYMRNGETVYGSAWMWLLAHRAPLSTERPARVGDHLTTVEDLDALPKGSIISTPSGRAIAIKAFTGPFAWRQPGAHGEYSAEGVLVQNSRFVVLRVGYDNPTTESEEA